MNHLSRLVVVSLLFSLFGLGIAQSQTSDKKTKATTIKNISGQIKWTGYGVGKSHTGTIAIKSGEVKVFGSVPTEGHFLLDMKTLRTADSEKLQGHLHSADFFDVNTYPEAHFKSTSIEPIANSKPGDPNYDVKGDLTVKDKTHPIDFKLSVTQKGNIYTGRGSTEIKDRTKYGIVYNSKQYAAVSKLGDKLIEDNITIDLEITAK